MRLFFSNKILWKYESRLMLFRGKGGILTHHSIKRADIQSDETSCRPLWQQKEAIRRRYTISGSCFWPDGQTFRQGQIMGNQNEGGEVKWGSSSTGGRCWKMDLIKSTWPHESLSGTSHSQVIMRLRGSAIPHTKGSTKLPWRLTATFPQICIPFRQSQTSFLSCHRRCTGRVGRIPHYSKRPMAA